MIRDLDIVYAEYNDNDTVDVIYLDPNDGPMESERLTDPEDITAVGQKIAEQVGRFNKESL